MKLDITEKDLQILLILADEVKYDPRSEPELFCRKVKELSQQVPKEFLEKIQEFAKTGSENGFLLFQCGTTKKIHIIAAILLSNLGEMIAYEAEGNGTLFQDIRPSPSMEKNQTSLGSAVELEIHTEQAFSKLRPDVLCLSCIYGNPEAFTHIFSVKHVLREFTPDEIQLLREPLWKTGVDLSFKLHGKEFIEGDVRGPMSILYGNEDDPFLLFDQDLMFGTTPISQDLLKKIIENYHKNKHSHCLRPGEIIFIDNRRALHGRSPFLPRYDEYDRFLVRCFATFDYLLSEHARPDGGRMVSAIYS